MNVEQTCKLTNVPAVSETNKINMFVLHHFLLILILEMFWWHPLEVGWIKRGIIVCSVSINPNYLPIQAFFRYLIQASTQLQ